MLKMMAPSFRRRDVYHENTMIRSLTIRPALLTIALTTCTGLTGALTGCQDVSENKVVLTQQQWREVEKQILKEEPTPQHKLNVNYGNEIELIGFDVEPKVLKAGEKATFTWYWKALETPSKNWEIFIHFDAKDKPLRQGLDHHPVNGLFKTSLWKKGQIIKDEQTVTIREDFPGGVAIPYIGLYNGKGIEARKLIVNEAKKTNDRRAIGPEITVQAGKPGAKKAKADPKTAPKPGYRPAKLTAEQTAAFKIDGKIDEAFWKDMPRIEIDPFGKGQDFETWAKIAYTEDALIVAAHLEDKHIWGEFDKRDSRTWEQEVFELFIDTNRDAKDYLELQITPKNVIFDANFKQRLGTGEGTTEEQIARASAWNYEGMETAVYIDGTLNDVEKEDKFWSIEMKLPFANFPGADGKAPADGSSWAMNLYRFDRPAKKQSFAYAWSRQTRNSFHDVPMFGSLRFGQGNPSLKKLVLPPGKSLKGLPTLKPTGDNAKKMGSPLQLKNTRSIDPKSLRKAIKQAKPIDPPAKKTTP